MENVFSHTAETWAQGVVLSHMLIVVCQLLFRCPPLLMDISEHNSFFEVLSQICLYHLLFFVVYHEC